MNRLTKWILRLLLPLVVAIIYIIPLPKVQLYHDSGEPLNLKFHAEPWVFGLRHAEPSWADPQRVYVLTDVGWVNEDTGEPYPWEETG